jgi:hypothetical protein
LEVDAMAMEQTVFGCRDAEPRVRRALIFHDQAIIATALSTSIQFQRVGVIDCFDDGFALADGMGSGRPTWSWSDTAPAAAPPVRRPICC